MKLLVAGSRDLNPNLCCDAVEQVVEFMGWTPTSVVSGKASRGADLGGELYAKKRNLPVLEFPADWDGPHKKTAGFVRNGEMAETCDAGVVIWDGVSRGSKNMLFQMEKYPAKPVVLWRTDTQTVEPNRSAIMELMYKNLTEEQ